MFSGNREELRQFYYSVWEKYQEKQALDPLEQQVITVILEHPEYHYCFLDPDKYKDKDFLAMETNPFLHMALHLAIREQVSIDTPPGIQDIYQAYLVHYQGKHLDAEHDIMAGLSEMIWEMQKYQLEFNEREYLKRLKENLTGMKHASANEEW